ncbi:BTAD domain-containing putative transcriptional regulator [Kineococcus sp. SYSU DK001]|uniref:BTAD domain-containing putative transcriptional regulator n=1 Tax=Kineococcus sp. SYSU DK001 TaxID=3383122 RepID=UPI003D7C9421
MPGQGATGPATGPDVDTRAETRAETRVEVRVLGTVELRVDGDPVPLGPSLRTVLAALALDAGRVVDADVLSDRVWGERGTRPAASTVHSSVSRLRRALAGAGEALATRAPGYRLTAHVDARAFERSLARARTEPDPRTAHRAVEDALARWHGPAYGGVDTGFAHDEARRLEARRVEALELRARLDLRLGRHREVLTDLADLVAAHPLHEDLRASLALALYRSDRQAEALAVLDEGRDLLGRDLGLDPGPALRRLRDRVLRQDPELDAPVQAPADQAPADQAPADQVPAVPDPPRPPVALPVVPTPLVGRDPEIGALRDLLDRARLVTLTGTGGVGKTRLAAAVADAARPAFGAGVWFVPLATVTRAAGVLPAVARAVGLPQPTDEDAPGAVAARLATGRHLLVLDNCEHLLEAAPDVATLVRACPDLSVLVTSRAPLRVSGEVEHRVAPLPPDPARELFCARARAVVPSFALDERTTAVVDDICRAVSGIPLALELAAARVRVLDVADLLARLDQALAGGPRDLPARQRSVRATLDWSCGLLDPASRGLFRRLGVFTGGWTLEVLEEVEGADVLEHLETLVEHSLVTVDFPVGGPARYSMLEPTLQHARRLLTPDERDRAALAHARAYARLAERAATGYQQAEQVQWLERLDVEHPNVLAALEWAHGAGERDLAARLVWASWLFWWLRGHLRTGRRAAEAVVSGVPTGPGQSLATVRARTAAAAMAFAQDDAAAARTGWQDALDACAGATGCTEAERTEARAHCEAGLGICALVDGDLDTAARQHRRAVELAAGLPADSWGPWIVRLNLIWAATTAWRAGRADDARADLDTALALARGVGDRLATYLALYNRALVEADAAPDRAARTLLEGVRLSEQLRDRANLSAFLEALVVLLVPAARRDAATAGLLAAAAAAAAAARESVGFEVYRYYPRDPVALAAARAELGELLDAHQLRHATARGASASLAEAVGIAVAAVTSALGTTLSTARPAQPTATS